MIGVVIARSGENWRVDIGSAHMASLDGLAFEGATKRNRPNLKVCRDRVLAFRGLMYVRSGLCCTREYH